MKLRVCLYSEDAKPISRRGVSVSVFTDSLHSLEADEETGPLAHNEWGIEFEIERRDLKGIILVVLDRQGDYGGVDFPSIHGGKNNSLHLLLQSLPPSDGDSGGPFERILPAIPILPGGPDADLIPNLTALLAHAKSYPGWTSAQKDAVLSLALSYIRLNATSTTGSLRPRITAARKHVLNVILPQWQRCLLRLNVPFRTVDAEVTAVQAMTVGIGGRSEFVKVKGTLEEIINAATPTGRSLKAKATGAKVAAAKTMA